MRSGTPKRVVLNEVVRIAGVYKNQPMPVSFQTRWFSQIRRCAQLQKLKKQLFEKTGGETVTDELWAQAAGETEESLRRFLDDGASAKQALGETMGTAGSLDGQKFPRDVGLFSEVVESYKEPK